MELSDIYREQFLDYSVIMLEHIVVVSCVRR
jgi:hypothetical protein